LIKSLIHEIKEQIFCQVQIDEIEKKMSKRKKNNTNARNKLGKTKIVKDGTYKNFVLQMFIFFLTKIFRDFQNSLIKSLIHKIEEQKNFQNFLTSTDR